MILKALISVVIPLLTVSCANPDYIDTRTEATADSDSHGQEGSGSPPCTVQFPHKNICAEVIWSAPPNSTTYNEFTLKFDQPVAFNDLVVLLWMPSMGHGSAPVQIEALSATSYRIHRVVFVMPGDWEIRIYLKRESLDMDQAFISLVVP